MYDGQPHTIKGYASIESSDPLYVVADSVKETETAAWTVTETNVGKYDMGIVPADFENINKNFANVEFVVVDGQLEISKRTVKLTSAGDSKVYDGKALTNDTVTVSGDGFADGEGATYDVTGTQTLVGSSENTFTYTLNDGTLADNYAITTEFGTLTVTDGTNPDDPKPVDDDLVVTKSVDGKKYALGETVTFTITATNIYEDARTITLEEIDGVTLAQSVFKDVEGGKSIETTATYTITEADILNGSFKNTVTAKVGNIEKTAPAVAKTEDKNGHLTIDKVTTSKAASADGKYALGEEITYKITVTNDGNLTITDITVDDKLTGDSWKVASLAPGESKEFTAKYKVTEADCKAGQIVNEATAKGKSPDPDKPGVPVKPGTDTEKAKGPHLTVTKTIGNTPANGSGFAKGEVILYIIQVINDGGSTITGITVKDQLTGDNWKIASLKPGETRTFTAVYTVGARDVTIGQVTNTAVPSCEMPNIPMTPGSITTRTGEYTVPLGIGAAAAQCGDCFE
jgi:uncharacterized repeat protein (TIGR01451 family)